MATTFVKIQTVTVGSGGTSAIDFTSIPQTYTDLKIVASLRSNRSAALGDTPAIKFNTSSSNFTNRYIFGQGSGTPASYADADSGLGTMPAPNATASVFGFLEVYIPNYTSANNKSFSTESTMENNATTSYAIIMANLWAQTAAITSISIFSQTSSTILEYSTATLYGIKSS
jgi:hypothetical protein